jgi:hypothetical protein
MCGEDLAAAIEPDQYGHQEEGCDDRVLRGGVVDFRWAAGAEFVPDEKEADDQGSRSGQVTEPGGRGGTLQKIEGFFQRVERTRDC